MVQTVDWVIHLCDLDRIEMADTGEYSLVEGDVGGADTVIEAVERSGRYALTKVVLRTLSAPT